MFIVQARPADNKRLLGEFEIGAEDQSKWANYAGTYETFEEANNDAIKMIKNGRHKAVNVRVVEIVAQYQAEVSVIPLLTQPGTKGDEHNE